MMMNYSENRPFDLHPSPSYFSPARVWSLPISPAGNNTYIGICHSRTGGNLLVSFSRHFTRSTRVVDPGSEAGVTSFLCMFLFLNLFILLVSSRLVGHVHPARVEESRREGMDIFKVRGAGNKPE
jgi:hypothetical protein